MFQNKLSIIFTSAGIALVLGCSHANHAKQEMVHDIKQAAAAPVVKAVAPGAEYAVVQFEKGSHALSQSGRDELNRMTQPGANQGRKIEDIKVLAWADREYPVEGTKATKRDVSLADDRADVIKKYITNEMHSNASVDKHNMAKRPGFFSELVKTDDYKLKKNLQNGTAEANSEKLFSGSKESKAIVLITYQ